MTNFIFPPTVSTLAIDGSDQKFPVRRIFCVGQNYAKHSLEMGGDPDREPPFFFSKPHDAVVASGSEIPFPSATENLHHEAELVVAIGKAGSNITVDTAVDHIFGYAAGNDLTRRDIQAVAKSKGRPWDMSKGFDNSAVVSAIVPKSKANDFSSGSIACFVDDTPRQNADLLEMTWKIPEIISYLSGLVRLEQGDLIMTGTPEGVGPLTAGQSCSVKIDGLPECTVRFTD